MKLIEDPSINSDSHGSLEKQYRPRHLMVRLSSVALSWFWLLYVDLIMRRRDSARLRNLVRDQPVTSLEAENSSALEEALYAMDLACVFYPKRVLCLQRAVATTILLRNLGWPAKMITGAQIIPYEFHAWVEVGEAVVNDKPYMREIYQVLESY